MLTERLVREGANVLAIEKDDAFAKHLEDTFAHVNTHLQQQLVQSYFLSLTMSMMAMCHGLTREQACLQVPAVTVLHNDILMLSNLMQVLKSFQPDHGAKLKVVSNIPYNITSGEGHEQHLDIAAEALEVFLCNGYRPVAIACADLLYVLLPMRDALQSIHLLLEVCNLAFTGQQKECVMQLVQCNVSAFSAPLAMPPCKKAAVLVCARSLP